jgi:membrane protease YdiL (CAAX protease family)
MPLFFAIAFGAAWACQLPVYLLDLDGSLAFVLLTLGAFAPSIAGVVVTRGAALRDLVRGPKPVWAIAAGLLGPTLLIAAAGAVTGTLVVGAPNLVSVAGPPIGEELGWRGYLQPRLRSSLAVGVIWAVWHLPPLLRNIEIAPMFLLSVVAWSVIIGWLWQRSRGSLLACVAAHAGINLGMVHAEGVAVKIVVGAVALTAAVLTSIRGRGSNAGSREAGGAAGRAAQ